MQLVDSETGQVLASDVRYARTFWTRFLGLMGRKSMPERAVLVIEPCCAVHTFFMRFPLDVLYLDKEGRVIRYVKNLKPWRIGPIVKGAKKVVELKARQRSIPKRVLFLP